MFGYKNEIVQHDMDELIELSIPWERLDGKTCLVTGANGMIATYLIYSLMSLVEKRNLDIHVIALSRNLDRSKEIFQSFLDDPHFELLIQDVCMPISIEGSLDYIFHFAGNASPYFIKNDPVGIMKSNLLGTINVLELAKRKGTEKVIFASTREVYGENKHESILSETSFGRLDCLDSRSCYPESKRAAESLCESYYSQYGVGFNAVRIAHAYGPGMKLDKDGRVMADLLNFVVKGQNIVLRSHGEALRAFCYITDVLSGLMYILFLGGSSSAYNLANESEEISIRSLAELLTEMDHGGHLRIDYDLVDNQSSVYCNYVRVGLDTSKLENLGWKPAVSLREGLNRVLRIYKY